MRLLLELVLDRARGGRQFDRERHASVVGDGDALDEIERHDIAAQIGILDDAQRIEDLGNGRNTHTGDST